MEGRFVDSFRYYQTYRNWFLDFNPLSKLNLLFALGFASMAAASWEFGLPLCIVYCILAFCAGKGMSFLKPFGVVVLIFGFFTLAIRQFSVEGATVLFRLFGVLPVTREALINGLDTASYLLGFSGAVILFFATTQMRDLMYSLEKKGMSHEVSYIVLASFQTITEGIETEGGVIRRIKAFFPILGPLVLSAISSTEEKSVAMDARAFSVKCRHTFLRELRPVPLYEKLIVFLADVLFLAVIGVRLYQTFG